MKNFSILLLSSIIFSLLQWTKAIAQTSGLLYGMTQYGGTEDHGTLFSYDPSTGQQNILLNFVGENGHSPQNGGLIQSSNGLLYGMTPFGGLNSDGVLFNYDQIGGAQAILINFDNNVDSAVDAGTPYFGPMQASDGLIYCVTSQGGSPSNGTIVSYDPQTSQAEARFYFDGTNGDFPLGALLQATDGLLYGITAYGGSYNSGVLYSFDPFTDLQSALVHFLPGELANCSLIQASDGLLYGALQSGGLYGFGVLFSYDISSSTFTRLFNFDNANGSVPNGLMQASDGLLYGLTAFGGNFGFGVLYSFDPLTGQQNICYNFHGLHGLIPRGNVIEAGDGFLYGTTSVGGDYHEGTLFKYDLINHILNTELSFHDIIGLGPMGDLLEATSVITSADNVTDDASVVVFPVPSKGRFTVSLKNNSNTSVFIYDSFGKRIYSRSFQGNTNAIFSPDLTEYPDGIYSLQVVAIDKFISRKIVIQK